MTKCHFLPVVFPCSVWNIPVRHFCHLTQCVLPWAFYCLLLKRCLWLCFFKNRADFGQEMDEQHGSRTWNRERWKMSLFKGKWDLGSSAKRKCWVFLYRATLDVFSCTVNVLPCVQDDITFHWTGIDYPLLLTLSVKWGLLMVALSPFDAYIWHFIISFPIAKAFPNKKNA